MSNFVLTTILSLTYLQSTLSLLRGKVCFHKLTGKYRCCVDYYAVGNECVACRSGYVGINCSSPCPPGYYGNRCKSACNCLKTETCHIAYGCLDIHRISFACKGENCTYGNGKVIEVDSAVTQGSETSNATAFSPEGSGFNTGYNFSIVVAALGSTTFLIFLIGFLCFMNLRHNKSCDFGLLHRVLPSTRPETTRRQEHEDNDYLDESTYADLRVSRMLPDSRVECNAMAPENSSATLVVQSKTIKRNRTCG